MTGLLRFLRPSTPDHPSIELGSFRFGSGYREASWSHDGKALLVPELSLTPYVIRYVATGGALFQALLGMQLVQVSGHLRRYQRDVWTYAWGDLRVFETGEPTMERAVFLRGHIEQPDLTTVRRYLAELLKAS